VGVDVENTRREIDTLKLAERYFAPSEAADLRGLAASSRQERFFEYWTLKEAYAKARGMGMSLPFDRFSFELTPGQPPRVSFSPALRDNAENWQFELGTPTEQHRLGVAVGPP
jgi:4'-phosphopantetheinyl transferase